MFSKLVFHCEKLILCILSSKFFFSLRDMQSLVLLCANVMVCLSSINDSVISVADFS